MGSGVDTGPDVGRGAPRSQYVVKRSSMIVHSNNAGIELAAGLTT
jgi:hypothetical protein